jgi:hypothetical protein
MLFVTRVTAIKYKRGTSMYKCEVYMQSPHNLKKEFLYSRALNNLCGVIYCGGREGRG